jgi:predicted RNase H-like nuclease (RuvC/YqgF family)
MSGPISNGPIEADQVTPSRQADLLAHIRLLQEALDATAPTEAALLRAERQITALQDQVDRLSRQIVAGQREVEALRRQVSEVRGSLSWRLTAPLRSALRALRGRRPHSS